MNKEQIFQVKPISNVLKKKIQNLEYSRNEKLGEIMKEKESNLMGASKVTIFPQV